MKRSERATTVALVAATAGLLGSLFWLFESFGPLSSIWELIVPAVTIACGAVAALSAGAALRRGTTSRSTAIGGLALGVILIAWGIALVPASLDDASAFVVVPR